MNEIIPAVIASLVGLIIGFFVTNKYNSKKIQLESITKNRMEWINNFRESVAELISRGETIARGDFKYCIQDKNHECCILAIKYRTQFDESKNKVLMVLNLNEKSNRLIYRAIIKLDIDDYDKFRTQKYCLMHLVRSFLKPEWERVKKLNKGSEK